VDSNPEVALSLVDRFLALPDPYLAPADGFEVKAKALERLGRLSEAFAAYESAIEAERLRPTLITTAALDFAELVVLTGATHLYARILCLLEERQSQFAFPVSRFIAHACRAVILKHQGKLALAAAEAALAFEEKRLDKSGFSYHQNIGLVGGREDRLLGLLHDFRAA
jgi:hypothetical protein